MKPVFFLPPIWLQIAFRGYGVSKKCSVLRTREIRASGERGASGLGFVLCGKGSVVGHEKQITKDKDLGVRPGRPGAAEAGLPRRTGRRGPHYSRFPGSYNNIHPTLIK